MINRGQSAVLEYIRGNYVLTPVIIIHPAKDYPNRL